MAGRLSNPDGIQNDIDKNAGFVLTEGDTIIGYSALLINDEPAYEKLEGQWLTSGDYVVFHRVAISESFGKRFSNQNSRLYRNICAKQQHLQRKADTNFDNFAMMAILKNGLQLLAKYI
jgi:hypothetical protein